MADNFGLKIGLEGEKEFKKAIADINQSFKVLGSEMKLVSSEFGKNDTSMQAVAARSEVLNKQIDAQKQKIEVLRQALKNASESFEENDRRTQSWQIQLNNAEAALNDMERELKANNDALSEASDGYTDAEKSVSKMADEMDDAAKNAGDMGGKIDDAGEKAERSGGKFEKLGSVLKGIGTAMGAVAAAAGAAAVKLGKEVISAYADYEQLVGGVDTLFKDYSKELQSYAANAYKTAGLSANEYMETVTSFSASLIQSLGGDTEKAVKYADMAITDMSDNANKMGTDMSMIQSAYQGFAKQNYTMLDNLKLGYGGTQEEMKRLISDANEYAKSIGQAGDLSIDSFSDIIEAIDLVQQKQNIAGTTSREAATTIEGSVNMMKAAWENWLTALGSGDWDLGEETDSLVESIEAVATNVIPTVADIVSTLIGEIPGLVAVVGPELADALLGIVDSSADALRNAAPAEFVAAVDWVASQLMGPLGELGEAFTSVFGDALSGAGDVLGGLAAQAGEVLVPALRDNLIPACTNLLEAIEPLMEPIANVAGVFGNILVAAITIFVDALSLVIQTISEVIVSVQMLAEGAGAGIDAAIAFFSQLPGAVEGFLQSVIGSVVSWASSMWSQASAAGSGFLSAIGSFLSALPGNVASWLSGAISTVVGWVSQFASNATSAASQFGSRLRDGLAAIPGTLGNIGANIVQGLVNGVLGAAHNLVSAVTGAVGDAIQGAKNLLGIKSPSRVFRRIGQYVMQGAALGVDDDADLLLQSTDNAMRGMISTAQDIKYTPDTGSAETTASVIEWLAANLGDIIASYTPYIGMRDLGRLGRKAMAYA